MMDSYQPLAVSDVHNPLEQVVRLCILQLQNLQNIRVTLPLGVDDTCWSQQPQDSMGNHALSPICLDLTARHQERKSIATVSAFPEPAQSYCIGKCMWLHVVLQIMRSCHRALQLPSFTIWTNRQLVTLLFKLSLYLQTSCLRSVNRCNLQ